MGCDQMAPAEEAPAKEIGRTRRSGIAIGVACGLYAALTGVLAVRAYVLCGHRWVYPLDDPYIEMAMARSLALHGVWGITRFGFTPASSAPLYTVLLALLYRVFGVNTWIPLALSWSFGLASIVAAGGLVERYMAGVARQTAALAAFVLVTPVFALGLVGMENALHLLLAVLFLLWMDEDRPLRLAVLSGLMVATRYESLFVLFPAWVLMAHDRRWRSMLWSTVATAAAMGCYAAYSMAHGGKLLPNSVLLKGLESGGLKAAIVNFIVNAHDGAHLLFAVGAAYLACRELWRLDGRVARLLLVVTAAGAAHMASARIGNGFRYEAYIIGCLTLALAFSLRYFPDFSGPAKTGFVLLLLAAVFLLGGRCADAATSLPQYSQGIYLQQWQMARFLRLYEPESSVAANDIGAISFFTDIHCTDLVGLADNDVFAAKRTGLYTTAFLQSLAARRGIQIAMVYDSWFMGVNHFFTSGPPIPDEWVHVADLMTPQPGNLGDDVVNIYAVQPAEAERLRQELTAFEHTLPTEDKLQVFTPE